MRQVINKKKSKRSFLAQAAGAVCTVHCDDLQKEDCRKENSYSTEISTLIIMYYAVVIRKIGGGEMVIVCILTG
jgi:hypothetical protein